MDRTEFQPWTITGGTLQLNQWPAHTGRVVVTVDVFEPFEGPVVSHDGFDLMEYPPPWGSGEETTISDCLQALFAHIDANPQATYHLRTLHPERVREAWPAVPEPMNDDWCDGSGTDSCPGCGHCVRHRDNVAIAAGPIRTQDDADRLLPELLLLSDLCREVYPWCQPVERIDMTKSIGEAFMREHGFTPPFPGVKSVTSNMMPPRIVVSGGPDPMHPDNVRCLRDQAAAAGVAFVFEGWGDFRPWEDSDAYQSGGLWFSDEGKGFAKTDSMMQPGYTLLRYVGSEHSGCELDGKTYPWESEVEA